VPTKISSVKEWEIQNKYRRNGRYIVKSTGLYLGCIEIESIRRGTSQAREKVGWPCNSPQSHRYVLAFNEYDWLGRWVGKQ